MHLSETKTGSETIYDGRIMTVTRDTVVLENGEQAVREVVHHSGGVCVVPLTDKNEVILVKQFRYPFADVLTEVPAGKREKGEDPLECGIRELKEEVGATADRVIPLGKLYPTVAYDTEVIYMYLATGLRFAEQDLDEDEFLDVIKMPIEEAVRLVMEDKIPDSKTQLALLKTYALLKDGRL